MNAEKKIKPGRFSAAARGLIYELKEDLNVAKSGDLTLLQGSNGVGKSTFLSMVLIPFLRKQGISFLNLSQEMQVQSYAMRAALAILQDFTPPQDLAELSLCWIANGRGAEVLILDEFDKYCSLQRVWSRLDPTWSPAVWVVSHIEEPLPEGGGIFKQKHKLCFKSSKEIPRQKGNRLVEISRKLF